MNINSIPERRYFFKEENNTIDLIWFPTGGGKQKRIFGSGFFNDILKIIKP